MRAEQFTAPVTAHGEGPVWWPDQHVRCVDMIAGDVLDMDEEGRARRSHVADIAAVVRPRANGGSIVGTRRGVLLLDESGVPVRQTDLWTDPSVRMNEGGCDPDGRFYCGSMAYDAAPGRGALYRFDQDGTATVVLPSVTVSNGLAFSPDGSLAYYVDSATQRIDVFDYDHEHGLTARRPFVTLADAAGAPDGLTVDHEGAVWVACWGGGAVRRYTAQGRLDAVVEVPGVRDVTACTLGGPQLDRLYITTSRVRQGPDYSGPAGALFVLDDVPPGLPVLPAHM